jgi:hypothetical protein
MAKMKTKGTGGNSLGLLPNDIRAYAQYRSSPPAAEQNFTVRDKMVKPAGLGYAFW